MKKNVIIITLVLLLSACSNSGNSGGSIINTSDEKNKKERITTEHSTEDKRTSEKPTTEMPKIESDSTESNKKQTDHEKSSASVKYHPPSYITDEGKIDLLSPEFVNDYFYNNHLNEFAGIRMGMPIEEVEEMYGKSTEHGRAAQYPTTGRIGDFALDYEQGKVTTIILNPHSVITKEQVRATYGEPTKIYTERENIFVYNTNKANGFKILVGFGYDDKLAFIQQMEGDN